MTQKKDHLGSYSFSKTQSNMAHMSQFNKQKREKRMFFSQMVFIFITIKEGIKLPLLLNICYDYWKKL